MFPDFKVTLISIYMYQVLGTTRMIASLEDENVREYVTQEVILECRSMIEGFGK